MMMLLSLYTIITYLLVYGVVLTELSMLFEVSSSSS